MSSPKTMMKEEDLEEDGGGDSWQPFILPLLTMSSPKTMMKGKISKRTVEETAGSLASSLTRSEFIFALVRLSKVSCKVQ
jgi:hypothetical protein